MESRLRLAGHAIHPMLIVFPLGLFASALIFDIIYFITGNSALATVSFWDIAGGVIGGLIAALFGLWDWLSVRGGTRARSIGLYHGVGNVVVVVLFVISWILRSGDPSHLPNGVPIVLEVIGVLLALVTGWLGGELVERLGVGVDPGANLDAPSSLAGKPASVGPIDQGRQQPPRAA